MVLVCFVDILHVKAEKVAELTMKKKDDKGICIDTEELQKYLRIIASLPEIRQEKVEEIKRKIESGQYSVDMKKIVKKMIEQAAELSQHVQDPEDK